MASSCKHFNQNMCFCVAFLLSLIRVTQILQFLTFYVTGRQFVTRWWHHNPLWHPMTPTLTHQSPPTLLIPLVPPMTLSMTHLMTRTPPHSSSTPLYSGARTPSLVALLVKCLVTAGAAVYSQRVFHTPACPKGKHKCTLRFMAARTKQGLQPLLLNCP